MLESLFVPRLVIGLSGALSIAAAPATGATVVINNGLAPPNPANVIDAGNSYPDDLVYVQNVGCDATVLSPCPLPWGAPTRVEVVDGGLLGAVQLPESSAVTVSGGQVGSPGLVDPAVVASGVSTFVMSDGTLEGELFALGASNIVVEGGLATGDLLAGETANITMNGGMLLGRLVSDGFATVTLTGGVVGGVVATAGSATADVRGGEVTFLRADDDSVISVAGTDFAVNDQPVAEGPLGDVAGTLTGTLESGEPIDAFFCHKACQLSPHDQMYTGLIQLVPEPDAALLFAVAVLSVAALHRRERPRPDRPRALEFSGARDGI